MLKVLLCVFVFAAELCSCRKAHHSSHSKETYAKSDSPVLTARLKKNLRRLHLIDDYQDMVNFLPKQLGVKLQDPVDKAVSAIGNTLLLYGATNPTFRRNSFRMLKSKFEDQLKSRSLYIQSQKRQIDLIDSVLHALDANIKLIGVRSDDLLLEIDSAQTEFNENS